MNTKEILSRSTHIWHDHAMDQWSRQKEGNQLSTIFRLFKRFSISVRQSISRILKLKIQVLILNPALQQQNELKMNSLISFSLFSYTKHRRKYVNFNVSLVS